MADQAPASGHQHPSTNMQIGLFSSRTAAEEALAQLVAGGYPESSLQLRRPSDAPLARYASGLLVGTLGGGIAGLVLGIIAGFLVSRAAPLVGPVDDNTVPFVIIGIFAVFGFFGGSTAGALFAICAVSDPAQFLNQELQSGHYLLGVPVTGRLEENLAESALDAAGADDVIFLTHSETLERVFYAAPANAPHPVASASPRP